MANEGPIKTPKKFRQRYFVARELQFSIALLTVIALLGGIFLQTIFTALINHYGVNTPAVAIVLILGYAGIVVILAVFFSNRLVGPFKRLEYEMKLIAAGELSRRLTIRSKDDLHIRNYVRYSNTFISRFEEMSKEYNKLNSTVSIKLDEISKELSNEKIDRRRIKEDIEALQKQIHELRQKW